MLSGGSNVERMLDGYLRHLKSRPPLTAMEEAEVWRRYKDAGDPDSRCRLIEAYQILVVRMALALGAGLEYAMDLVQEGTVGLIEAVESFDPDRGVPFPAFAQHRIRGRMFDYLRRQKVARGSLSLGEAEPGESVAVTVVAGPDTDPEGLAEEEDVRQVLQAALARLPQNEHQVMSGVYLQERRPDRVAEEMAITVSYLHRLEKRAIRRLRGMLARAIAETRTSG